MRTFVLLSLAAAAALTAAVPAYQGQLTPSGSTGFGDAVAFDGATLAISSQSAVNFYVWNGSAWKLNSSVATPNAVVGLAIYKTSALGKSVNGAYAFEFNGTNWVGTQSIPLADGAGVGSPNIIAIRSNTAAVGAPNISGGRGQVYVLGRSAPGSPWSLAQTLYAQTSNADNFGQTVALGATSTAQYLLVGAPMFNSAKGNVYAYQQSGFTFTIAGTIPSPASGTARFGQAMSSLAGNVLIGAPANFGFVGAAYLYAFAFNGGAISSTQTAMIPSPAPQLFGEGLVLTNTFAVIGSPSTLTYYPYSSGAIGGPNAMTVPAHSGQWGFNVAAQGTQIFMGDSGANSGAGAVSLYR